MDRPQAIAVVMVATAWVTMACAVVLWRRRGLVGARSLSLASVAVGLWALFYAAELLAPSLPAAVAWGDLKYIGVVLLPPAWLVFALRYTGRGHLVTTGLLLGLSVHPTVMAVLLALPETHDLVRGAVVERSASGIPDVSLGPLFWPHYAYVMVVLGASALMIVRALIATSRRYLMPSVLLVAAQCVPWIANVAFNWPGLGFLIDLTPVAYAMMDVVFVWGVFNFKLFNVIPVAREAVLDTLEDAVVVVDAYWRIADVNTAGELLLRTSRRQAVGVPLTSLLPDHPDLEDTDEFARRDITLFRGDGVVDFEVRVSSVRSRSAHVPGYVLVFRDVSERRRSQRRLEHLVYYDQLTGLPNRLLYRDRLDQALALARRSGRAVGVLFLDLDGFKAVNDTLGHEIGDLVLRETAERLQDSLRESDTAARMGGDEFIIVLPSIDSEDSAGAVAKKILAAIAQPYTAGGQRLQLSASVGIAVAPPNPFDRQALGKLADAAMYEAKAKGKNIYAYAGEAPALTIVRATDQHGSIAVEDRESSQR